MSIGLQWNGTRLRALNFLVSDRPKFRSSPTQTYTLAQYGAKPGAFMGTKRIASRDGSLIGVVYGRTAALAESALDTLKGLFAIGGTLTDVSAGNNTRSIEVVQQGAMDVAIANAQGTAYRVSIPLLAVNPFWEAGSDTTVILAAPNTPYAAEVGSGPSYPVIVLANCTDPTITYRNSAGDTVKTLALTITVSGADKVTIDMENGLITKTVSGVTTNAIDTMSNDSDFPFALDPADGVSPDIKTSSGTGTVTYRKAYL